VSPTKPRDLALIGLFVAALGWLLVRQYYGDLPPLRWYLPLSFAALGVAELIGARTLRSRIRGSEGLTPGDALGAAGALALAKASAVAASGFLGLWLGLLAYTVPNVDFLAAVGNDTVTGVIGVTSSGLLVAAALVLEDACRTPRPPGDRDERS